MLEHVATRTNTTNQQVCTFNDVPLGAAAADRYIILAASNTTITT